MNLRLFYGGDIRDALLTTSFMNRGVFFDWHVGGALVSTNTMNRDVFFRWNTFVCEWQPFRSRTHMLWWAQVRENGRNRIRFQFLLPVPLQYQWLELISSKMQLTDHSTLGRNEVLTADVKNPLVPTRDVIFSSRDVEQRKAMFTPAGALKRAATGHRKSHT